MGGEGSGRKPDIVKQILEQRTPILINQDEGLFIPNYSGIQKAALKTSAPLGTGGGGLSGAEIDPIFMALSGSLGYVTTESDPIFMSLSGSFVKTETDPVFMALSGAYTKDTNFQTLSGSHVSLSANFTTLSGAEASLSANFQTLSGNYSTTSGGYIAHAANSSNPHGVTLTQTAVNYTTLSGTNIYATGTISGSKMIILDDYTASGAALIRNIIIGVETAPLASSVTQGTIYLKYTA